MLAYSTCTDCRTWTDTGDTVRSSLILVIITAIVSPIHGYISLDDRLNEYTTLLGDFQVIYSGLNTDTEADHDTDKPTDPSPSTSLYCRHVHLPTNSVPHQSFWLRFHSNGSGWRPLRGRQYGVPWLHARYSVLVVADCEPLRLIQ